MYKEFTRDDNAWFLAENRDLSRGLYEAEIKESKAEGKAEGEAIGDFMRLLSSCALIIENIYHIDGSPWLETLSIEQLELTQKLAFQEKDFDSLKAKVENNQNTVTK